MAYTKIEHLNGEGVFARLSHDLDKSERGHVLIVSKDGDPSNPHIKIRCNPAQLMRFIEAATKKLGECELSREQADGFMQLIGNALRR